MVRLTNITWQGPIDEEPSCEEAAATLLQQLLSCQGVTRAACSLPSPWARNQLPASARAVLMRDITHGTRGQFTPTMLSGLVWSAKARCVQIYDSSNQACTSHYRVAALVLDMRSLEVGEAVGEDEEEAAEEEEVDEDEEEEVEEAESEEQVTN